MRPLIHALEKVHRSGLIHRDISPDNIMLLKTGQLKLLDFGAARESVSTKTLSVILKPGYAPEEQYRYKGYQGPWTDVYALCATMYTCLTGIVPEDSLQRMFQDTLQPPSQLCTGLTQQQEYALLKGLSIRNEDRFQSMEELEQALYCENYAAVSASQTYDGGTMLILQDEPAAVRTQDGGGRTQAMHPPGTNAQSGSAAHEEAPHQHTVQKKARGRRSVRLAAAAAAVLLTAVLAVFISNGRRSSTLPPSGEEQPKAQEAEVPETEIQEAEAQKAELQASEQQKLSDFDFTIDGVSYQLPFPYSKFSEDGWSISTDSVFESEDDLIPAHSSKSYTLVRGKAKGMYEITVNIINMSGNMKKMRDCNIGGLRVHSGTGPDISIANGIRPSSTQDEVLSAFGSPDEQSTNSSLSTTLFYKFDGDGNSEVDFIFGSSGSNTIYMRNFAATPDDETITSLARPAYLDSYSAPDSLGSDVCEPQFMLDGKLYRLPCPLSEFTDDGWYFLSNEKTSVISGGCSSDGSNELLLGKNGYYFSVRLANYDDLETLTANCAVYHVFFRSDVLMQLMELRTPGGLAITSD